MFLPNPTHYILDDMKEQIELNVINLLDPNDKISTWLENVEFDSQYMYVIAHGNNNMMGTIIYVNGKSYPGDIFSAEDIANILFDNGWNGEIVCLFACSTAQEGVLSIAQEVADLINGYVVAPKEILHIFPNGFYYVSDEKITNQYDDRLFPQNQEKMWEERGVIVW